MTKLQSVHSSTTIDFSTRTSTIHLSPVGPQHNSTLFSIIDKHQHPQFKCVVQSYLHWLDDSDYNPVCRICDDQLATGECIRLVCYDLFHKECLNDWASRLPPNTAPAGYKCPVCSKAIFPPPNLVSPIADRLQEALAVFPWARTGLGLPLVI
nr:zinc finger protein-like 1 [Cherax quadricarinatus]